MRQKFSVTVADISMNIVCDETQETIDRAVTELDEQLRAISASSGNSCTRTEAALLAALDYSTRSMHLSERVKELESFVHDAPPAGDSYEVKLLRGENEALRAQMAVEKGLHDALLQDNATLFQLNAKLARQNYETNARADRMHDQVLSILTEVRELREKLAKLGDTTHRAPLPNYEVKEPEPPIEITPEEQKTTHKYEQMDLDDVLAGLPRHPARPTPPPEGAAPHREVVDEPLTPEEEAESLKMFDLIDYEEGHNR